jgi:hypothetical protein
MNQSIEDAELEKSLRDRLIEIYDIDESDLSTYEQVLTERASRQSSQSEPVAVFTGKFKGNVNGKQWIECELTGAMPNTGDLLYAAPQQAIPAEQVPYNNYVQPVPDHCDRITWRNRYYSIELLKPASPTAPIESDK